MQDLLEDALSKGSDPIETLAALGPRLFELLTSDRAIALNRAAAADGTGELGAALTRAGREKVMPLIAQVIALAEDAGALGGAQPGEAARLWLDLLVGDVQIRRAIGAVPVPDQAECERRGAMALHRLRLLLPPA